MESYWSSLGAYLQGLEGAGKLIRVSRPVNKDTELHPLVRLQFRGLPESQRKAFLFENVVDSPPAERFIAGTRDVARALARGIEA
jgi:3-polyprenyl-4-hydroxybenzoate decarboxylase